MNPLTTTSPIDGRYYQETKELQTVFSEATLMRCRLVVEIEYFIALSKEPKINEVPPLSPIDQNQLRSFYKNFSLADAQIIKDIESTTNHDVKAIEYFIKQKIADTPLQKYSEFIHFALTSEDINNIAYSLMWQQGVRKIYLPNIIKVYQAILDFAQQNKNQPMLSLTHGQSATPTTVGKEFLVFAARLKRQVDYLEQHQLLGKLAGATGTWSAQVIAYPEVDWLEFSKKFINYLGLEPNLITTQIEPHDSIAESYQAIERINNILIDFTRDVWLYISRGILGQKKKAGEVGSSTMPHKINPIQFENAEGNLGLANAYFSHLCQKLPVSRMQRDLSDSTVLRNQGVPLAHSLLANKNILKGLSRLTVNQSKLEQELDEHWEVLSEAIQTILRKVGYNQAYEKLKDLTRGQKITQKSIQTFINNLNIPQIEKQKLLKLTPQTYTGLAEKLVNI